MSRVECRSEEHAEHYGCVEDEYKRYQESMALVPDGPALPRGLGQF